MDKKYYMNFEDSQEYISKRGLDVPWNDCDVFIDEREITRTVGNVLLWADENPINYDGKAMLHVLNKSAEQAKKLIITKACEWWENELTYPSMTPEEIEWYKNKINDFCKAMIGE